MKRVYIAYTGGTIGMTRSDRGYAPAKGYLEQQMTLLPELRHESMPEFVVNEYDELLDSANMRPEHWYQIAQDIADNYDDYDGFVVIHGTDTMAYTASALPLLLNGLNKPVIVTGSQIPLCEVRNDARANLITAIRIAGDYAIPEVCILFGDSLVRGCRARKVDADGLSAFMSPNFPRLGVIGIDIDVRWNIVRPPHAQTPPLNVPKIGNPVVAVLRLFPGITAELMRNVLKPPLQGLVLEAYGVGNGPDQDTAFLDTLREATERGVVIVDCTQCWRGRVDLNGYAAGAAMAQAGVISGFDMTTEAALTKMVYLFSQELPADEIKHLMQTDLQGELTRSENVVPVFQRRAYFPIQPTEQTDGKTQNK